MSEFLTIDEFGVIEPTSVLTSTEEPTNGEVTEEKVKTEEVTESLENSAEESQPKLEVNNRMPSIEKIKELFESKGYYAEESLLWDTYLNIETIVNGGTVGQEIQAICLEGPPGSGKTLYAKLYSEVLAELLSEEVDLVSYQCDSTTGKAELYEEIKISAAITGDAKDVIIPGKIVEAIDDVNGGKKVILFLDEYDKAKEETDAFLLSFLQDGKINTTQRGEMKVDPEKFKNLQVILCKNDMREELSGPLERRLNIIRLDNITPDNFSRVAKRALPNVSGDLKELLSIYYQLLYSNREDFKRIPSCPELLKAMKEADTLINAGAPQEKVHRTILTNMLKNQNDFETFEDKLKKKIKNMDKSDSEEKDHLTKIFSSLFEKEISKKLLALENDKNRLQANVDKLEEANAKLQSKYTDLQNTHSEAKSEKTQYKSENTRLQNRNSRLENENTQLQAQNSQLQNDNAQLKNEKTQQKNENVKLGAENTKLINELEALKAEFEKWKEQKISDLVTPTYIEGNKTISNEEEKKSVTESLQFFNNSLSNSKQINWYKMGHVDSDKNIDINDFAAGEAKHEGLNGGVIIYEDESFTVCVEKNKSQGQDHYKYNFLSNKPIVTLEMVEKMSETISVLGMNGVEISDDNLKVNCLVAKGFDTDCEEVMPGVMHLQANSLEELARNEEFGNYTYINNYINNVSDGSSTFVLTAGIGLYPDQLHSFLDEKSDANGNKKLSLYDTDSKEIVENLREMTDDEAKVMSLVFKGERYDYSSLERLMKGHSGVMSYLPVTQWAEESVKGPVSVEKGEIDGAYTATIINRGEIYEIACFDYFEKFKKIKRNNHSRAIEACNGINKKAGTKSNQKVDDIKIPAKADIEIEISLM